MTPDHWRDIRARFGEHVAESLARDYVDVQRQYVAELADAADNLDDEERRLWGLGYAD